MHFQFKVAVVEVERFWTRYKQLGCNKQGNLQPSTIEKGELNSDLFVKNVSFSLLFN